MAMLLACFGLMSPVEAELEHATATVYGVGNNSSEIVSLPELWDETRRVSSEDEKGDYYGLGDYYNSVHMSMRRGYALFNAGHDEEAITEFEKCDDALAAPTQYYFREQRACGRAYEKVGKTGDALVVYERCAQADLKARLLVKLRRYSEAIDLADRALSQKQTSFYWPGPKSFWYWLRASAKAGLGLDASAVEDLKSAAKLEYSPFNNACIRDANLLIARSRLGEPISSMSVEEEPDIKYTKTLLVEGSREWVDFTVSNSAYFIEKDPDKPDAYRDHARVLVKVGKFAEALSVADKAIELGGRPYIRERAAIEAKMGDHEAAIKDLKSCLDGHSAGPETKELWLQLADVFIQSKQHNKAFEASNNAMVGCREKARAMFLRAKAQAGLGDRAAAESDGQAAAQECFSHLRIRFRDKILDWLAKLETEGHL